jgi:hypothetical protein
MPRAGNRPNCPSGCHVFTEASIGEELMDKSQFDEFQFIRGETRFQHELLSARVNAYFTSQAFLVTALAIFYTDMAYKASFMRTVIPITGVLISLFILAAIVAAAHRINAQRELEMKKCGTLREQFIAMDKNNRDFKWGAFYATAVPFIFIFFWITALILEVVLYLRNVPV